MSAEEGRVGLAYLDDAVLVRHHADAMFGVPRAAQLVADDAAIGGSLLKADLLD